MAVSINVHQNEGHPGDSRPGFDLMYLTSTSEDALKQTIEHAKKKFWHVWLVGENEGSGLPGAVLYKPSGAREEWVDEEIIPE